MRKSNMNTAMGRKIAQRLFALALVGTIAVSPFQAVNTNAAGFRDDQIGTQATMTKNMMKEWGVNFDLQPNKTFTYDSIYEAIGTKKQSVKISNYRIVDATVNGDDEYNKLTFTVNFDRGVKLTDAEINKILDQNASFNAGNCFVNVVDYKTGKSLEAPEKQGKKSNYYVTVKKDWKIKSYNNYSTKDGYKFSTTNQEVKVTVTYPKRYKRICIGVGGYTKFNPTTADKNFSKGTVLFKDTSMYSKTNKNIAHFMRVK